MNRWNISKDRRIRKTQTKNPRARRVYKGISLRQILRVGTLKYRGLFQQETYFSFEEVYVREEKDA